MVKQTKHQCFQISNKDPVCPVASIAWLMDSRELVNLDWRVLGPRIEFSAQSFIEKIHNNYLSGNKVLRPLEIQILRDLKNW